MTEEAGKQVEEKGQEEIVKKQQIAIATSMKVAPGILKILGTIEEWHIREWLYICAVDGMPETQIQQLADPKVAVGQIRKARMEFLGEKCIRNDAFHLKIEKLQKEVKEVCEESRQARSAIENGLEDALKREAQAQAETIRVKEEFIESLKTQVQDLQRRLGKQKPVPTTDVAMPERETDTATKGDIWPICRPSDAAPDGRRKKGPGLFFAQMRQSTDTKRFIDRFVTDGRMSGEQMEFLLGCLEEGMSLKKIENIASPELTVEVMRRLKQLQQGT